MSLFEKKKKAWMSFGFDFLKLLLSESFVVSSSSAMHVNVQTARELAGDWSSASLLFRLNQSNRFSLILDSQNCLLLLWTMVTTGPDLEEAVTLQSEQKEDQQK